MKKFLLCGLLFLLVGSLAPAQLSGNLTIGPTGSTYQSFKAATVDLYLQGLGGPVVFVTRPGTYKESIYMFPGATKTNTITFFNPIGKGVKLEGNSTDTITVLGSTGAPCGWVTFDGFEFDNSPGALVFCNQQVAPEWEFRNCVFGPNFGQSGGRYTATFYINCSYNQSDSWNIHHNKFTLPAVTNTYDGAFLYAQGAGKWNIHHNEIDLNGAANAFSMWNQNYSNNRIRNNLFYGPLYANKDSAIIRCIWSMYDIEFAHNTCLVELTSTNERIFEVGGCCTTRRSCFYSNIIYFTGNPAAAVFTCKSSYHQYFYGDGNIYWQPGVTPANLLVARDGATTWPLTQWRTQVPNQEKASVVADPLLLKPTKPYVVPQGFNVVGASPAVDKGVPFPGYATFPADPVTTDYIGRYRDDKPDVGAFEGMGFATFGSGCPGTGKKVPQMGYTGTVAIPSPAFAVTVKDGLASSAAFLVMGNSLTGWQSIPLPFDLGGGCQLVTGLTLLFPAGISTGGTATQPVPIPNLSLLMGSSIYAQWVIADPGSASPYLLTTSDGGAMNF